MGYPRRAGERSRANLHQYVAQRLCQIEAGATTIIADHDPGIAESGRDALRAKGYDPEIVIMDVTQSSRVNAVADDLVGRHGRVDILVNNAGIARSETPAESVEDEHWLNVIDVNLNGLFWCCRAFGRHMLTRRSGSIVNIGSMSGFIVNKPQEQSYYNASKAGVRLQGGRPPSHQVTGGRMGYPRRAGERSRANLHQYVAQRLCQIEAGAIRRVDWWHADGTARRDRRGRRRRSLLGVRCGQPDDRQRRGCRRGLYLLVSPYGAEPTFGGEPSPA